MESAPPQAVDGSAEASSPEAEAFCEAEVAVEQASTAAVATGDASAVQPAMEALVAASPADLSSASVEELVANAESGPGDPAFDEPYAAIIEYMKANCGFAELDVAASDYAFGGIPGNLAAGPTIVTLQNIGEEVHEIVIWRINDDVTMSLEELLALPEEEIFANAAPMAFTFTFPGATGNTVADLTPGRYFAICFLSQGSTPEVIMEMGVGPEATPPPDAELGPPHFTLGMVQEFDVA